MFLRITTVDEKLFPSPGGEGVKKLGGRASWRAIAPAMRWRVLHPQPAPFRPSSQSPRISSQ
ncbi:MAG: hypothetical protein DMG05_27370 [Acidobacteria bacterium]|nr:MAG: hypothetical protein DMG05_27370 [Acidobacteriota bacterium]